MPLPTFKTADEIPEAFRSEYEEKDGVWVAKPQEVEKGPTRKEIERREAAALKKAKEAEDRAKELEQELAAKSAGVSPEELQKIRKSVEDAKQKEIDGLKGQLHEATFGQQMNAALADAGVIDVSDARAILGPKFDIVDGNLVPKHDKSIPAKQYLDTLRSEKPHLFKGSQADGGGSGGSKGANAGSGKIPGFDDFTKMSLDERNKLIKQEKAA
jgi:hypothetical protein